MQKDLRFVDYFLYTQYSLATFDRCPLKFKKRYLDNLKWDSTPSKDSREKIKRGMEFHLLANRYFMDIDDGLNKVQQPPTELTGWMNNLKRHFPLDDNNIYLPEYKIRMANDELKLEANIDLIVVKPEKLEIWDWKTHGADSKFNETTYKNKLINSLQTMVYMFVVKEQINIITDKDFESKDITMYYWQPEPAGIICSIGYSDKMHEQFRQKLRRKMSVIEGYDFLGFNKEQFANHCRYCEFNWFCNNQKVDYQAIEEDTDFLEEMDWDQVEEIY